MKLSSWRATRRRFALLYLLAIVSLQLSPFMSYAQNLGQQPATGQAVQGQTAAQPEGTVLNLVNWVGNVIAPVGAALAVGHGHSGVFAGTRSHALGSHRRWAARGLRAHTFD